MKPQVPSDGGFTLIELLIAMLVGSVVVVVGGAALYLGLATTGATGDQLERAIRTQLATARFQTDVNNAEHVDDDLGNTPACEDPTDEELLATSPSLGDPDSGEVPSGAVIRYEHVAAFAWGLWKGDDTTATYVDWRLLVLEDARGSEHIEVRRVVCDASRTPESFGAVLTHRVGSDDAADPEEAIDVACDPDAWSCDLVWAPEDPGSPRIELSVGRRVTP